MHRGLPIVCLALLPFFRTAGIAAGRDASTRLHLTEPAPSCVGPYGRYEVTFQLDQLIEKPFNADEIDVQCVCRAAQQLQRP